MQVSVSKMKHPNPTSNIAASLQKLVYLIALDKIFKDNHIEKID
jgi:hypothetical protein